MITLNQICKDTDEFLEARVVTFLNPYSYLKITESKVSLDNFDKICIDGVALKIFLELVFRQTKIERISFDFTSIAGIVFDNAVANQERGFVIGSDPESNLSFLSTIRKSYEGIDIDGRSGFFENETELANELSSISDSQYDFIIIGMGAVKQEQVANNLLETGFKGRIYTCGGFIHQTAMSGGEYYPMWIDKLNLRFAYRMFKEPTTILRYIIDYPKAFYLLTRNKAAFKH